MTVTDTLTPEFVRFLMVPLANAGHAAAVGLEDLVHRPQWMAAAACRDEPTETFFPDRGVSTRRARELCAGCEVQEECLAYAMADTELIGWWGGTSTKERRRLRGATPARAPRVMTRDMRLEREVARREREMASA